jgi:hypothetical protein
MPDLPSVTTFINSPPGQLVAGAALAGIVWKFFEKVEAVLTDSTRHEIARWLRVRNVETGLIVKKAEPWPKTFASLFERVFGKRHFSWKCFWRSWLASMFAIVLAMIVTLTTDERSWSIASRIASTRTFDFLIVLFIANAIPDFFSLLATRWFLRFAVRYPSFLAICGLFAIDFAVTLYFAHASATLGMATVISSPDGGVFVQMLLNPRIPSLLLRPPLLLTPSFLHGLPGFGVLFFYPAFFTSIWLWLYAGSGFILKGLGYFDAGFERFNKICDIEKKPLSAIGLVAGSLVAILYWSWAAFRHFCPA